MSDDDQKTRNPVSLFKSNLNTLIERRELALPSDVSVEAFRNAAIIAVQDNPQILRCDDASVFRSIRRLAGMGLVPDGREAALVPFGRECTAMPMVFGLIKMARNSGEVSALWAEVVYEGEAVKVWVDNGERRWDHVRDDGGPIDYMDRGGAIRGAYAVVKLRDGTVDMEPMTLADIEKRRKASANQKGDRPTGIWRDWYEEMAQKTVIRSLCKRIPMSGERLKAIMESDGGLEQMRDVTPQSPGAARLADLTAARGKPPAPDPADEAIDALDGEVIEAKVDEASEWFKEGVRAYGDFGASAMCPESYGEGSVEAVNWQAGFAQEFKKENGK